MEKDDFLNDDFLKNLIGKSSLEGPPEGFVEQVMSRIQSQPEAASVKKSFFLFLKSSFVYFLLAATVIGFFLTSDIPFMSWIPGKQYFLNYFIPSFNSLFTGIKSLSGGGKTISIPLMIVLASALFFFLDRLLAQRRVVRHHPMV